MEWMRLVGLPGWRLSGPDSFGSRQWHTTRRARVTLRHCVAMLRCQRSAWCLMAQQRCQLVSRHGSHFDSSRPRLSRTTTGTVPWRLERAPSSGPVLHVVGVDGITMDVRLCDARGTVDGPPRQGGLQAANSIFSSEGDTPVHPVPGQLLSCTVHRSILPGLWGRPCRRARLNGPRSVCAGA